MAVSTPANRSVHSFLLLYRSSKTHRSIASVKDNVAKEESQRNLISRGIRGPNKLNLLLDKKGKNEGIINKIGSLILILSVAKLLDWTYILAKNEEESH